MVDLPMELNLRWLIRVEPDLDQNEARFRRRRNREFPDVVGAKFVDIVFYLNELRASNEVELRCTIVVPDWMQYPAHIESVEGKA